MTSLAVVLLLPWSARAQEAARRADPDANGTYRIEALVGYWSPRADVTVSSDATGVPGTKIDWRRDLGLTSQGFPELQLSWRPALRHTFRAQYIPIRFESSAAPPRDLVFNGVRYQAGLSATASLDWTTYRFGYDYAFVVRPRVRAGFIAEVKHTIVRAAVQNAGADEVSRQAMPVPALGGVVRLFPSPRLSLAGEFTFFAVPDRPDGHYGGHVGDVDVSALWTVTRHLGAQAGFREIDIHHLGEWNTAMFTLKGVYLAALVRY